MAFSTFNSIQSFLNYVRRITSSTSSFTYNFPALDPSLVLYYPMDTSANVGGGFKTPNYASGLPVYDASMAGSSMITLVPGTYARGIGDLSLNNTLGSTATNYVVANNTFAPNISGGFSIAVWFSCSGQLNKTGTLITLPSSLGPAGIRMDVSGTNMIYSGYNPYGGNGLVAYWPFDTNFNEVITGTAPTTVNSSPTISNSVVAVGTGSFNATNTNWGGGVKPYIAFTSGVVIPSASGYTISVWFYLTSLSATGNYPIVYSFSTTANSIKSAVLIQFNNNSSFLYLGIFNDAASPVSCMGGNQIISSAIATNTWYNIVVSFPTGVSGGSNKVNVWINNVKQAGFGITNGVPIPAINRTVTYINSPSTTGDLGMAITGYIDDLRVYNRILSDAEVSNIYNKVI